MKITLNNKEIELKYSFRSMMMYENITGKSLEPKGLTDILTFFYCVVLASSKDYSLEFDKFIDWVDENPNSINEFGAWLSSVITVNNSLKKN